MFLLVLLVLSVAVPVAVYFSHGGGSRRVWGLVAAGEEAHRGGIYRHARATLWKRGSAPLVVRVAALSSFFLGQMIVPGTLAALVGAWATIASAASGKPMPVLIVVQLSAPTGLVVAAHLLAAGSAMLQRADDAVATARRAARWALGHNLVLLVGLAGAAALGSPEEAAFAALSALYACISIGQALLVRRAGGAIEAYASRQSEESAPVDVELQLLEAAR